MILILAFIISMCGEAWAHSGRTDSNGGHKDNKNVSGLGSYHYHCNGNPAHLHTNGVCPYDKISTSITSSTMTNNNEKPVSQENYNNPVSDTTNTKPQKSSESQSEESNIIEVTKIKIDGLNDTIQVGDKIALTAIITPENATDKTVKWKSSDDEIDSINELGVLNANKEGKVYISVSSTNNKIYTQEITIQNKINNDVSNINNMLAINTDIENEDKTNAGEAVGTVLTIGAIGGGGYWLYKKKNNT